MGGKASRDKGLRWERELVALHRSLGVPCERVPLSGSMKGSYAADLRLGPALGYTAEAKRRARAYGDLYDAIAQDNADLLFVRADNKPPLVVMPWITWATILQEMRWISPERSAAYVEAQRATESAAEAPQGAGGRTGAGNGQRPPSGPLRAPEGDADG